VSPPLDGTYSGGLNRKNQSVSLLLFSDPNHWAYGIFPSFGIHKPSDSETSNSFMQFCAVDKVQKLADSKSLDLFEHVMGVSKEWGTPATKGLTSNYISLRV
jgi:hypothetical protein